jgi:WD40 repeat protein
MLAGKDGAVKDLSLSSDGRYLVVACADRFIRVYE